MLRKRSIYLVAATATAAVAALATWTLPPAEAQERKSIRWTTTQVGSYGYTIAASMAKVLEQALGGEYTVTVHPYQSPTVAMKAVMGGEGEIAYTADIGMTQFAERVGPFKDFAPTKPDLVHTWYAYPMESMMATSAKAAGKAPPCSRPGLAAGRLRTAARDDAPPSGADRRRCPTDRTAR
jgi:TRAP-type uncharacterized transport system substrate-binding protein